MSYFNLISATSFRRSKVTSLKILRIGSKETSKNIRDFISSSGVHQWWSLNKTCSNEPLLKGGPRSTAPRSAVCKRFMTDSITGPERRVERLQVKILKASRREDIPMRPFNRTAFVLYRSVRSCSNTGRNPGYFRALSTNPQGNGVRTTPR